MNSCRNGLKSTLFRNVTSVFGLLLINKYALGTLNVAVPPHRSIWITESHPPFLCRLSQKIDTMGDMVITLKAGEEPTIEYELQGYSPFSGYGEVSMVPSTWGKSNQEIRLTTNYRNTDNGVIFHIGKTVPWILTQLTEGMNIRLDLSDSKQPISIESSSVNIKEAVESYRECISELLPINYDQISTVNFYYLEGQFRLNEKQKRHIKHIMRYIRIDPNILGVSIDAHTDTSGDRLTNLILSRRRQEELEKYLKLQGLDPEMIVVSRHHGERYPAYRNSTFNGRQKNRRTILKVYRINEMGEITPDEDAAFRALADARKEHLETIDKNAKEAVDDGVSETMDQSKKDEDKTTLDQFDKIQQNTGTNQQPASQPLQNQGINQQPAPQPRQNQGVNQQPAPQPQQNQGVNQQPASQPQQNQGVNQQPASQPQQNQGTNQQPAPQPRQNQGVNQQPASQPQQNQGTNQQPASQPQQN